MQPWCVDNTAIGDNFEHILKYNTLLCEEASGRGYFPKPTKSTMTTKLYIMERTGTHFQYLRFKVTTGTIYLGGHIGGEEAYTKWVVKEVCKWLKDIKDLAKFSQLSPQCDFEGSHKSLQSEWIHLQRSIGFTWTLFEPMEEAISGYLIPAFL